MGPEPNPRAKRRQRSDSGHRARHLHVAREAEPPSQATAWGPSRSPEPSDGRGRTATTAPGISMWRENPTHRARRANGTRLTVPATAQGPNGPTPTHRATQRHGARTTKPAGPPSGPAAATPEQEALERVGVWPGVLQAGQQALAVGGQELGEQLLWHAGLVVGEQGAPDPLDHLVAGGHVVQVDLEPDVLG